MININFKLSGWIVVASLTWLTGYTFNRYYEPEVQWIKSMYEEKVERLDSTEAPKRLLVIGGSGTHFGVDTMQIERELGVPVFNLGLHAGLGLNAIIATFSDEIRSGDIVLFTSEYHLMTNDGTGYYSSSFGAAMNRPGIGGIGSQQIAREIMLMGVPGSDRIVQLIKRLQRSLSSNDAANASTNNTRFHSYNSNNVDERGNPRLLPSGNPVATSEIKNNISEQSLLQLKRLRNKVEEAEATLVLGLPWLLVKSDEKYLQNRETVQKIANALAEIAPVVCNRELNLKTNSKLFGDTNYHLSSKGRELRSSELALQLRDFDKKKCPIVR